MKTFTARQQSLIDRCKATGYGWAKFASSVEAWGSCSIAQEDTLCHMVQRIDHAEAVKAGHFREYDEPSISDIEAMRSNILF